MRRLIRAGQTIVRPAYIRKGVCAAILLLPESSENTLEPRDGEQAETALIASENAVFGGESATGAAKQGASPEATTEKMQPPTAGASSSQPVTSKSEATSTTRETHQPAEAHERSLEPSVPASRDAVQENLEFGAPSKSIAESNLPRPLRQWTDASGRHVTASLHGYREGQVGLETTDGKVHWFALSRLSPADRLFVLARIQDTGHAADAAHDGKMQMRTWEDLTGTYRVKAALLTIRDGEAVLLKEDGEIAVVRISQLSQIDQGFVQRVSEE